MLTDDEIKRKWNELYDGTSWGTIIRLARWAYGKGQASQEPHSILKLLEQARADERRKCEDEISKLGKATSLALSRTEKEAYAKGYHDRETKSGATLRLEGYMKGKAELMWCKGHDGICDTSKNRPCCPEQALVPLTEELVQKAAEERERYGFKEGISAVEKELGDLLHFIEPKYNTDRYDVEDVKNALAVARRG